jgi:phosphoserine aminotransferase
MNFNAGPSALPLPVLERARDELVDFEGSGMSIMEHSHRGKVYERVHEEATARLAKLLGTPRDEWDVMFVQGGASMAFAQLPLNFLVPSETADYVVTGAWGEKALSEARAVRSLGGGEARLACSTKAADGSYTRVPKPEEFAVSPKASYVHITSNETIHGVQFGLSGDADFPRSNIPVFVDMSSDILGRVVDVSRFDLLYAGAQKNIGPSGVTVVVAKKSVLERGRRDLPVIYQYRTMAEHGSLYNTPPTFGIYLVRSTLEWLEAQGGVSAIEDLNRAKARVLYDAIERSRGFYRCPVEPSARSIMNVVWKTPSSELDDAFVEAAKAERMVGLKGHRVVGGLRASIYNAVEPAWCNALASFMDEFARRHG